MTSEHALRQELKTVWTHSRVYTLAAILQRAAGFVLIPVYAHVLPVAEFGTYAMIVMLGDIVGAAFGIVLSNGMLRVYFDYETRTEQNRVVSTTLIALGLGGIGIAVLLHPLARMSSHVIFGSSDYGSQFALAYAAVVFTLLGELGLNYFRIQKRSWVVLCASCAKVTLFLTLNILFVVVLGMSVTGILLGTLISSAAFAVAVLIGIVPQVGVSFSPRVLRALVSFGAPLLPAVVADTVGDMTDKYFLNRLGSVAMVGAYALGNRVAAVLHLFMSMPFANIWVVRRFECFRSASDQAETAPIFTYFVIVITTAGLGASLMAREVVRVVSSADYADAARVVPLLVLSYIVLALKMQLQLPVYQSKRTGLVAANSAIALVANIPLTYVLVGQFGLVGAAISMLLTNVLRAAGMTWLGRRFCAVSPGFEWRRVSMVVGLAAVTYGLAEVTIGPMASVAAVVARIGALLAFVGLLSLTGVVSARERSMFVGLLWAFLPARVTR